MGRSKRAIARKSRMQELDKTATARGTNYDFRDLTDRLTPEQIEAWSTGYGVDGVTAMRRAKRAGV